MWTRSELKLNAKNVLRRTYWTGFAVCLIGGLLAGVAYSPTTLQTFQIQFNIQFPLAVVSLVGIISLLFSVFIVAPLAVGMNGFFMRSREYDVSSGKIFSFFSNKNYGNIIITMFLKSIFQYLWTLLLIIPGIIKGFEYYFIPYILAENPALDNKRIFELSKRMTDGIKFKIFVLQLSFFGWNLLGMLACCVGTYFVAPYISATFAELYAAQRMEALTSGIATEQELCGFLSDEI
ncbi:MAG: DUF975 family protein [Acetivibrio sp.]